MKKYIKGSFKYISENWLSVLCHILIPAIFYTIFINPTSSYDFIIGNIESLDVRHFWEIFTLINDSSKWVSWEYAVFFFGIAIITLVIFSSFIGRIQNRMRYGKALYNGFKGVLKRTNDNMLTTIVCGVCVLLAMELYAFAMSIIIFLAIKITHIAAIRIILVLIFGVAIIIGMFYILSWAACALPNMTMRGMGFFKSVDQSFHTVAPKIKKVFGAFIVPAIISYVPVMLFSTLDIVFDNIVLTIVRYIFNFIFYAFSFTYYLVLIYTIFFDLNEIEREDINIENKWRVEA